MNTIPDLLRRSASLFPGAPAVEWAKAARHGGFSYSQLHGAMLKGADFLRQGALRNGDKVLLHMESRPEWAAVFFSILEAGLVVVPIPVEAPPAAIATISTMADAKAAVLSAQTRGTASVIRIPSFAAEDLVRLERTEGSVENISAGSVKLPRPELTGFLHATSETASVELAILAFTSGSTADPRAVELSHANILADLNGLIAVRQARPGDAFLSLLPPAHMFELTAGLLGPLACGARVVYPGSLLPNRLVAALREEQITHTLSVPALLEALYIEVLEELIEAGALDARHRGQTPSETSRRIRDEMAPLVGRCPASRYAQDPARRSRCKVPT